jgi:hypothetical protein
MTRKALPVHVKRLVLHEGGYKCANPVCRTVLTLDIHHLVPVAGSGEDLSYNLLALCPNCHALHHQGHIPEDSLRAWKMLLLALNEALDRRSIDLLLALDITGPTVVGGEGVLQCASLIAAGLVERIHVIVGGPIPGYAVQLTDKGRAMVSGWKQGDQKAALGVAPSSEA